MEVDHVDHVDVDRGITPPLQTNKRPKKTLGLKGPLACMRPRVKCSQCDFTGKEGKEMRGHVENKHKNEFSTAKNVTLSQRTNFCEDDTSKALMARRNVKAAILMLKMKVP